mmetsp:Transcript_16900/g.43971  ORF Transcript_16900/g.43971 Transcript_16900/m.43971 type:complete len:260 (+) Transcript_16900:225-1004(+)
MEHTKRSEMLTSAIRPVCHICSLRENCLRIRHWVSLFCRKHQSDPRTPPTAPMIAKTTKSPNDHSGFKLELKVPKATSLLELTSSALTSGMTAPFKIRTVRTAATHAASDRQMRAWVRKDTPSSSAKRIPPIGAPNAAATPAAAPAATKRCLKGSVRNCSTFKSSPNSVLLNCGSPAPRMAPAWIIGPSFPVGIVADTTSIMPITLTTIVRRRSQPRRLTPFRNDLISGMPDPRASGAKNRHSADAASTIATSHAVKTK